MISEAKNGFCMRNPLLVCRNSVVELPPKDWTTGEAWVGALKREDEVNHLVGIVLPLELEAPTIARAEMFGLELLEWLRWSAPISMRSVPVTVVSWQSVVSVLRKKPDLLLVTPGTYFLDVIDVLRGKRESIIKSMQDNLLQGWDINELSRFVSNGDSEASRRTYHDFANNHYAAYRLWQGYKTALSEVPEQTQDRGSVTREIERVEALQLHSERVIKSLCETPWFSRFKVHSRTMNAPAHPQIAGAERLFHRHVTLGLPEATRVLFVDDEFNRGMGDVLLQILFRTGSFTYKAKDEWVYSVGSDHRKARFVCVRSAELARNWLRYWQELPFANEASIAFAATDSQTLSSDAETRSFFLWVEEWAERSGSSRAELNQVLCAQRLLRQADRPRIPLLVAAQQVLAGVDHYLTPPVGMKTVMLLDLRLKGETVSQFYSANTLTSAALRRDLKEHNKQFPILMFTASRQAMNYASIMAGSTAIDGWLSKEAPDCPEDNANSATAARYLISRVHLFTAAKDWYRDEMDWPSKQIEEYGDFLNRRDAAQEFEFIAANATMIVDKVAKREFAVHIPTKSLSEKLRATFEPRDEMEMLLVARRVIIATLFMTALGGDRTLRWNAQEFIRRLRSDEYLRVLRRNRRQVYVSHGVNQKAYCFSSLKVKDLLSLLLPEELSWLNLLDWERLAPRNAAVVRSLLAAEKK